MPIYILTCEGHNAREEKFKVDHIDGGAYCGILYRIQIMPTFPKVTCIDL